MFKVLQLSFQLILHCNTMKIRTPAPQLHTSVLIKPSVRHTSILWLFKKPTYPEPFVLHWIQMIALILLKVYN
jgi:hypothetical protein